MGLRITSNKEIHDNLYKSAIEGAKDSVNSFGDEFLIKLRDLVNEYNPDWFTDDDMEYEDES